MGHETFVEASSTVFTHPQFCCKDYKDGGKTHNVCESMELAAGRRRSPPLHLLQLDKLFYNDGAKYVYVKWQTKTLKIRGG
jgi:hypothetical protein